MIPQRLHLRNFMCYRGPTALDLTGIHLACLAGDNGHGKSALLDAMTWALWGRARARYDDELVTIGQTEMEVQLDFLLDSAHYRIIRKRELGRHSRSALEFQIEHDGQFRSLTTGTQRDTQSQISQILRMDYDTFVNSALVLQGRADEFTIKAPSDRKRVLADILGLGVYEEYEQRAKALAQEKEVGAREVEARIQEIERELEHLPQYQLELSAAHEELTRFDNQAKSAESALQVLRDRLGILEAQRTQLTEVQKRIQTAESQVAQMDEQVRLLETRIGTNASILQRRVEIEAGHARLLQVREQETAWASMLPQLLALNEDKAKVEQRIAEMQKQVELKVRVNEDRIAGLLQTATPLHEWEVGQLEAAKRLQMLASEQAALDALRMRASEMTRQKAELEAEGRQLGEDLAALKDKVELLKESAATCPLCGQSLAEQERLHLLAQLKAEGSQKAKRYRSNRLGSKQIADGIAGMSADTERLERELKRLPAVQAQEATLLRNIQHAQEAVRQIEELRQALQPLHTALHSGEFAAAERLELGRLEAAIAALGYDRARHLQAQRLLEELAAFESEEARLRRAEQALDELRSSHQQLSQGRENWSLALDQDRQSHAALAVTLGELPEVTRTLQASQAEADVLRSQAGRARQRIGAAQQKCDHCHYLARERQDRAAQLQQLLEDRGLYEELQLAFGKKGLQALIIEAAIPEIEAEANQLLSRMTEGRMSLRFDTQRDTKSGNTIETLDIKIADEAGPRSYELYSGGEAFRVNLAIRIALSKLLARRAGARLQTLIIDEGFGTQDAEGRQRLVEAIRCIQDDFGLVLVVTHIDDLKDAFPVRIDVLKTPQGSQVSIS